MTAVYNIYLWDECCHQFVSTDTGTTFVESGTPDGGDPPVSTLGNNWTDAQMAINDNDYLTFVAIASDFHARFSILAISKLAGTAATFTLNDPEKSTTGILPSPAFMPSSNPQFGTDWQNAFSIAVTANAQTMLFCTNTSSASEVPFYPRITSDGGSTWSDVTSGLPASQNWSRAAFSISGTIMYLLPDNYTASGSLFIYKSTDSGATWTQLAAGPIYQTVQPFETNVRMRCSADGQVIVTLGNDGNFWLSTDGGVSWTNTDFSTLIAGTPARYSCDCSVTPDGNTIIVAFDQLLNAGPWPAVFVSTNRGTSFTDITANIQYPASVGPPVGGAPGTNPPGCSGANVAPDGLGMVVCFSGYLDDARTGPDGFPEFTTYANVSVDAGATFSLKTFTADALESSTDGLGVFSAAYILPFTPITDSLSISESADAVDTIDAGLTGADAISETANATDTVGAGLTGVAGISEAASSSDTIDATQINVTRPLWMTIDADSGDSVFPN